ncbi:MAG: hypothetical protein VW775_05035, partial [Schleiferiaceae bacterium]
MSSVRLSKATKELNISLDRAVEELAKHGHDIPNNRNHKITDEQYEVLMTAFADDLARKKRSEAVSAQVKEEKDLLRGGADEAPTPAPAPVAEEVPAPEPVKEEAPAPKVEEAPKEEAKSPKVLGKIDLEVAKPKKKEVPKTEPKAEKEKAPVEVAKKSGGRAAEALKAEAPASKKEESKQETEIRTKYVKIDGPKFTGEKIELPVEKPKGEKKKRVR